MEPARGFAWSPGWGNPLNDPRWVPVINAQRPSEQLIHLLLMEELHPLFPFLSGTSIPEMSAFFTCSLLQTWCFDGINLDCFRPFTSHLFSAICPFTSFGQFPPTWTCILHFVTPPWLLSLSRKWSQDQNSSHLSPLIHLSSEWKLGVWREQLTCSVWGKARLNILHILKHSRSSGHLKDHKTFN